MVEVIDRDRKKEIMKDIILKLHQELTLEEAKSRFEEEIGSVTSTEIAEIEQTLINEGISPEEVKKFCNVHALLFESALEKSTTKEESPAHPVSLFKRENREIGKITGEIKQAIKNREAHGPLQFKQKIGELLSTLRNIEIHYTWKEQVLFPFLERYGFSGPSKVMWGKDDEIRELLKRALMEIDNVKERTEVDEYIERNLNLLIQEIEGMIFKEERILFPTSLEKLPGVPLSLKDSYGTR